jgi:hypothetical protein
MRKPRSTLRAAAAAIAAGGILAAVVPTPPAVAFFSPPLLLDVRVLSPATLIAKGAAVSVPVEVTCAGGQFAEVSVSVSQRVGSGTATGFASDDVPCTGQRETTSVTVLPDSGSNAFRKGTGFARAVIFGCTERFCGSETDSRTISIVR